LKSGIKAEGKVEVDSKELVCDDGSSICIFFGKCIKDRPLTQEELKLVLQGISRSQLEVVCKSLFLQLVQKCQWTLTQASMAVSLCHKKRPRKDGDVSHSVTGSGPFIGCAHYKRFALVRAPCCGIFYSCRLCHDEDNNHKMDRYKIEMMKCMECYKVQAVNQFCSEEKCVRHNHPLARYYCGICKLFDDDQTKQIYHCPYCNICRLGKGLGIDFRHCMKCNCCINLSVKNHNCLSKALEGNCPICGDAMFTSTSEYKGLRCGHLMHLNCYKEYVLRSHEQLYWYRCPVCRKSMDDMTEYFSQLDAVVEAQPMPEEFTNKKVSVNCLDCENSCDVIFHFMYNKCLVCGSYNTQVESHPNANNVP